MFRKLFVFVLIGISAAISYGQTPNVKKETAKTATAYAFSFDGDGSYLGIQTQEVNKDNFAKFGLNDVRGVAVEGVSKNSPASSAGLQNGDVIVRFNGEEVTSTRKLTRLVSEVAPDHQVRITIFRSGGEQEINATLAKRPTPKFDNGNFTFSAPGNLYARSPLSPPSTPFGQLDDGFRGNVSPDEGSAYALFGGRQIGVSVYSITKQLGETFGVDGGVMISGVTENSPAAKAGLKAGDIITEVDGKKVINNLSLIRAIAEKKEGDVTITFVRDHNRQTVNVTPEKGKDGGFFFQTGDDDKSPVIPHQLKIARPATPAAAPTPLVTARPARIL